MLQEVAQALASLKVVTDLTLLILKTSKDVAVLEKAAELNSAIISLQQTMMAIQAQNQELLTENDQLKKELIAVKDWESEAQKYTLTEIAPGILVYASNPDNDSAQPLHWLCTHCYQGSKKSLLQRGDHARHGVVYFCPDCQTKIVGPYDRTSTGI